MKKRLKTIFMLLSCAMFALAGGIVGVTKQETSAKAMELTTETEILTEYNLGQEFVAPEATILYEGKNYDTSSAILHFPNGTSYKKEKYSLNSIGEYTLEYQAVVNGEILSFEKTFKVNAEAYSLGANSVLEYKDSLDRITSSSVAGLHIALPDKSTFVYNEPINIYDYDVNKAFIRIHPYSDGGNDTNLESLKQIVRLTDCYDANNYIEVELCWDYANHVTKTAAAYYRASINGGESIGIKPVASDTVLSSAVYIAEQKYAIYNGKYGAFSGTYDLTDAGVAVYFDSHTNAFYVEDKAKILVSDLDNSELYGEEAFKGFTTGEVYISVLAEEYYTGNVNIDISMLAGMEEKELHIYKVNDKKAPEIVMDIPSAEKIYYIAKNESITFPKATAYDVNLSGSVTVGVYSNYGTPQCRQHSYKNNIFTPIAEGLYTVVYTAQDLYGNVGTKTLTLSCIQKENNQIVDSTIPQLTTLVAGEFNELPQCALLSENGDVKISKYYRFLEEDEKTEIIGDSFLVENVGDYEIIYEYSDVFTSYRKSYQVTSKPSSNVRFDEAIFPKYLISNAAYTFEPVFAYTYENKNPTRRNAEIFIIPDGDENKATKIDYSNVTIPNCSTVKFKYSYNNASVFSQDIPVVDVGFGNTLKMQEYFVGNFEKSADANGVHYQSKNASGSNTLEFVNILSLSSFSFSCFIPSDKGNFESIDIILTDYYNRNNSVKVSYINKNSTTYIVCGSSQADIGVAFEGFAHKFYYNSARGIFSEMSGKNLSWNNTFSSDKILLQVVVNNIVGSAEVGILEVGGQLFSNDTADYFKPTMLYDDDGGVKKAGDIITINVATVIDVLSPFLQNNLTLSVIKPSGGYAVSDDGISLQAGCATDREYTLTLTEDGKYRVQYSYTDASGNLISGGFVANVSDIEPPTIKLNGDYNETTIVEASLNTKVTLQGYSVSDDKTPTDKLNVKCIVYSPIFEHVFVTNNQFEALRKGIYTVYYYVYDEIGNYAVVSYKVYVS